jgi:GNAT superfamily N-acetyltransferase
MANFSQTHPAMAAKLADLCEAGLDPEQIIQHFKAEDEKKALDEEEGVEKERFPDEIQIISQALAYRAAELTDAEELWRLLNSAYQPETSGSESFRDGEGVRIAEIVQALRDTSFKWILVEAPSGKGVEADGVILGAACFSTDGLSRRNGVVEGTLASLRYLGVLPRYHGFCLGRRLLERVEEAAWAAGCVRAMACLPSTRESAMAWVQRRGYFDCGVIPYPATLKHNVKGEVQLVRFIKEKAVPEAAPSTTAPTATWHLRNAPTAPTRGQLRESFESKTAAELDELELDDEDENDGDTVIGVD